MRRALADAVAAALPRVMTLCDRAWLSPEHGSADRAHWHYRTDKDHPSATYAQIAWPLALLATGDDLGVVPSLRPRLADLAIQTMWWWTRRQHSDGSFDEWFPYERSHVATAFTTVAIAEAARALGPRFAESPAQGAVRDGLRRAAGWLRTHHDRAVGNHAAGAAAALASVADLLPELALDDAVDRQLEAVFAAQDEDGFLPEYGGADPGYGTVSLAFLTLVESYRPSPTLASRIDRLVAAVAPFCNPDGSFGGVYGRRATRYGWLSGFARSRSSRPLAAAVLGALGRGLTRGSLPTPAAFDDRYLCFFAFPDAVATLALLNPASDDVAVAAPLDAQGMRQPASGFAVLCQPASGFAVLRAGGLHVVVGARVGGAVAAFRDDGPGTLLYDDAGYVGRLPSGQLIASWRFGCDIDLSATTIASHGPFSLWSRRSPVAQHPIGFRLFTRTLGRLPTLGRAAAALARRRYTVRPALAPLHLGRRVSCDDSGLQILDRITAGVVPEVLRRVSGFAPVHVPSAPLWLPAFSPQLAELGPDLAPQLRQQSPLDVITRLVRQPHQIELRVEVGDQTVAIETVPL